MSKTDPGSKTQDEKGNLKSSALSLAELVVKVLRKQKGEKISDALPSDELGEVHEFLTWINKKYSRPSRNTEDASHTEYPIYAESAKTLDVIVKRYRNKLLFSELVSDSKMTFEEFTKNFLEEELGKFKFDKAREKLTESPESSMNKEELIPLAVKLLREQKSKEISDALPSDELGKVCNLFKNINSNYSNYLENTKPTGFKKNSIENEAEKLLCVIHGVHRNPLAGYREIPFKKFTEEFLREKIGITNAGEKPAEHPIDAKKVLINFLVEEISNTQSLETEEEKEEEARKLLTAISVNLNPSSTETEYASYRNDSIEDAAANLLSVIKKTYSDELENGYDKYSDELENGYDEMPFEKFVENFLQNELDKINSSQRPSIKGESLINRVQELYNNPKSFNLEKFKELIAPLTKEEINHQDEYGNTALHYAAGVLDSSGNKADKFCAKPHKEMVLALSGHGANGYIKNGNRLTPLGLLTDSKNASTNPGERKKLEGLIGAVSKEKNDGTILSSATRLLGSAAGCTIG